jgi:hypothetical protein
VLNSGISYIKAPRRSDRSKRQSIKLSHEDHYNNAQANALGLIVPDGIYPNKSGHCPNLLPTSCAMQTAFHKLRKSLMAGLTS